MRTIFPHRKQLGIHMLLMAIWISAMALRVGALENVGEPTKVEQSTAGLAPLDADALRLVSGLHTTEADKEKLGRLFKEFKDLIEGAGRGYKYCSVSTANQIAPTLIGIYKNQGDAFPGARYFVIEFVAMYSDSDITKAFLKKILSEPAGEARDEAIRSLAFSHSLKGNRALANNLIGIYSQSERRKYDALAAALWIDEPLTLPILYREIRAAKKIQDFNKLAAIVSRSKTPSALKPVLQRVFDFPMAPAGSRKSPTLGIYSESLIRFIDYSEDDDLNLALKVLRRTGAARATCYDVLLKKLNSPHAASRRYVYEYFSDSFARDDFADLQTLNYLTQHLESESDPGAMTAGRSAVGTLRTRLIK